MTDFAAKVQAGIKLLDREVPNWRSKVDLDELDLGSCSVCVLGQVFGDYDDGIEQLGINGYDYGFNTTSSMSALTAAWREALGTNGVLVEYGDVYKDSYNYAVKVIMTQIVTIDGESKSVYICDTGKVDSAGVFTSWSKDKPDLCILQKKDFEAGGTYRTKVVPFSPKAGMFVTNAKGQVFYMTSSTEVREVKEGSYSELLKNIDKNGLKELKTAYGSLFSSVLVK